MKILYVSHNSIGSPLVRSQVLPYLRELAAAGVESRLLTFERDGQFPDGEFDRASWSAVQARPGHTLLAKGVDVLRGIIHAVRLTFRDDARLVHARSYLPAAIALVAEFLTGRPFVFDMRGFLGEEYVEGGQWHRGNIRLRVLRFAERLLLRRTAGIVVLTKVAADRLCSDPVYRALARGKPIVVVPCAVDLSAFRPSGRRHPRPTLVYTGSLAEWYLLDEMLSVYRCARATLPELRFLFVNRGEHRRIEAALGRHGLDLGQVEVVSADFRQMPQLLAPCHVGIVFSSPKRSIGASPIKVAEYLACGLPVVVNAPLGDVGGLVERYRAGFVVRSFEEPSLREAGRALARLTGDADARANARRLAEVEYDVKAGAERYRALYARVAGSRAGR